MDRKPVEDDAGAQATLRETQGRRVPDELVKQLHEANGRADELRKELERTMDDVEYSHGTRVGRVGEELRKVEREIEVLSERISRAAPPEAKG